MRRICVGAVLLGLLLGGGQPAAQTAPGFFSGDEEARLGSGEVVFGVDFIGSRGAEGLTREEMVFQVHADQLSFLDTGAAHRATFEVDLALSAAPGDTALQRAWVRMVEMRTEAETTDRSRAILDVFPFDAPAGRYTVTLIVTDRETRRKGTYGGTLEVPAFKPGGLALSQVQFASRIAPAEQAGAFVKHGMQVEPNITRALSTTDSALCFYYECYGLSGGEGGGSVSVAYSIQHSESFAPQTFTMRFRTAGENFARAEPLKLGRGLEAGRYTLKVQVRDDQSRQMAASERMFTVMQPLALQLLATDEASLERYYDQIKYIARQEELKAYKSLDSKEKVAFILAFWKQRDPTPDTALNEFAHEHFRRIEYANARFVPIGGGHGQKQGMDTDMGRVYIKYGPPDEVDDQLMPSATGAGGLSDVGPASDLGSGGMGDKPVQIWYYERTGGYRFIFRDRFGLGVYELAHSTYPGERYDPDWSSRQ